MPGKQWLRGLSLISAIVVPSHCGVQKWTSPYRLGLLPAKITITASQAERNKLGSLNRGRYAARLLNCYGVTMKELTEHQEIIALHFAAFSSRYYGFPLGQDVVIRMIELSVDPFPTITRRSTLSAKAGRLWHKLKLWFRFCAK